MGRIARHADIEPQGGNPVTEVGRSLNGVILSSILPRMLRFRISDFGLKIYSAIRNPKLVWLRLRRAKDF
ncbi:MAG: hypothetical protein QME81_15060 [bacterium]|nr:hypothetical protein [bacterium]